MSHYRTSRHVPWYHQPKARCQVHTAREEQCLNSASYRVTGPGLRDLDACKVHADILVASEGGARAKRIADRRVNLDSWTPSYLRAVSLCRD